MTVALLIGAIVLLVLALTMGITHTLTTSWTRNGDTISKQVAVTAADVGENNLDVTLTALQSDKQVVVGVDVSTLKSLYIYSDVDCTIEWNNNAGAQGSLTITAESPLQWYSTSGVTNPLGVTDITNLYVTNLDNTTGTVKIRLLQDATP